MSLSGEGSLHEEECPSHKHVEWTVGYEPLSKLEHDLRSPIFKVGSQSFELKVCYYSCGNARLTLYRRGPSVQHPSGALFRYWVGLMCRDGTYHYLNFSGELDLREEKEEWCEVEYLAKFYGGDLKRHYLREDKCLTFFFRLNMDLPPIMDQKCVHGGFQLSAPAGGSIRETLISSVKHLEWNVSYRPISRQEVTSPIFTVGEQNLMLEVCYYPEDKASLILYRSGPSAGGDTVAYRYWSGLKRGDGSYHHQNRSGILDLREEWRIWSRVAHLGRFSLREMQKHHVSSDGRLTVFFRMKVEKSCTSDPKGTYGVRDMDPGGTGSLFEEEWSLYKQVQWNVEYRTGNGPLTSTVFQAGVQSYLLELSGSEPVVLALYRRGPTAPAKRSLRWWACLVRPQDSSPSPLNRSSAYGDVDLADEKGEFWSYGKNLLYFEKREPYERMSITIDFLIGLDDDDTESSSSKDYMTFQVGDEHFTIHRAILGFRYPSLRAMYCHGTTESSTGLVRIEDCEPHVFKLFLDFVDCGESQGVSEMNACALYVLADKYLADDLKEVCLRVVASTITPERIAEVANLALVYGEDELMDDVAFYLAENKSIVETEAWKSFYSDFPCAAYLLLKRAFLSPS